RSSYLDYAMSVIVSRALPDVRDGLKPVHRRILFAMREGGYTSDKQYRKSARVVGDIIGKYHPHGEQAVYDALVRMTQDFSMRLPLLDGQGNFGSMDGDRAAAMRYSEVRMAPPGEALLEDIELDTVDFQPNYDESEREPVVVPARIPHLLVNGAGGIAVGMATNIPPHNLGEVVDACCAYVDNPNITIDELMVHVPAPDFPTGALILGTQGARTAYHTGRGSVMVRGRVHMEKFGKDRDAIVIDDVPYQVNKAKMIEAIADAAKNKRIEGISELRDETSREGLRVVIEVRRDATPEIVLNQIYRFSGLQSNFSFNMLALIDGRPVMLDLQKYVSAFVAFREEVITRRTRFKLAKARERAQILVGLAIAVANIDEVVKLIRQAPDPATAKAELMARDWPAEDVSALLALIDDPLVGKGEGGTQRLNELQAKAILELRLSRLTGLERDKISSELEAIAEKIRGYLEILSSRERLMEILRAELVEVKEKFATPRRTGIEDALTDSLDEDLIEREDMVITVTQTGYIKRVALSEYRAQRRGGKGRTGMSTRDEDFVTQVFVANTHTPVLFFSSTGKVYKLKVYRLPSASPTGKGKAMVNLLPLAEDEAITTIMPWPDDADSKGMELMFATSQGKVRRNALADFENIMSNGKIAMGLADGDHLVGVITCSQSDDVVMASRLGKCIRFPLGEVRLFKGRTSAGVRGMKLAKDDEVISLSVLTHLEASSEQREDYLKAVRAKGRLKTTDYSAKADDKARDEEAAGKLEASPFLEMAEAEEFMLGVTENGFGKRTSAFEYRTTRRGGQGILNIETSDRNGKVVASFPVEHDDQAVMMTDGGQIIRMGVDDIRVAGRNTQGVTLFSTSEGETVVSVAHLANTGDDDDVEGAVEGDATEAIEAVEPTSDPEDSQD
ncbi:MAG: DNA gyrase subunit A, partial [Alphaproteobacteria bacterium]|nr:DNA gyrase subunit A [Alphaproteobacteria bacterium]